MKKIISILFAAQFLTLSIYYLFYLGHANFYDLIWEDRTPVFFGFEDDISSFEFLLDVLEYHDVIISRNVYPNDEIVIIYTSDVTLDGRAQLILGRYPAADTEEFVSTIETNEENQVGLLYSIISGYTVIVAHINNPQNFGLDGIYHINTMDWEVLRTLENEVRMHVSDMYIFTDAPTGRFERVFLRFFLIPNSGGIFRALEFALIFPMITICLITSLAQYTFGKIKNNMILYFHGFSKAKISKLITLEVSKIFVLSAAISYMLIMFYAIISNQAFLLRQFTSFYVVFFLISYAFYLFFVNFLMLIMLNKTGSTVTLKGKKVQIKVQGFNHFIKIASSIGFLLTIYLIVINFQQLRPRLNASVYWSQAENVYRITVNNHSLNDLSRFDEQKSAFYQDLATYHNGFVMDIGPIQTIDHWESWGFPDDELHILDRLDNIRIDANFLRINPIYDSQGEAVYDQLLLGDYTINLLIPERFLSYTQDIYDSFYEELRWWNETMLIDASQETKLNIIYVPNGQYYFSFNNRIRIEEGNRIKDPIVQIYHGRVTDTFHIPFAVSHSLYFIAETNQPFSEIQPLIYRHGLESEIQRVEAIYDQNRHEIRNMQEHHQRLLILTILLFIANITIAYNLISNYFEAHKFEIFLKSKFGWTIFKQNEDFLLIYFAYSIPLIFVMSWWINWLILLVGVIVLVIEITAMLLFQQRLLKKSFAEIMKGER